MSLLDRGILAAGNQKFVQKKVRYFSKECKQTLELDSTELAFGDYLLFIEFKEQVKMGRLVKEYYQQQTMLDRIGFTDQQLYHSQGDNPLLNLEQLLHSLYSDFCENKETFVENLQATGVNSHVRLSLYCLILLNQSREDFTASALYQEPATQPAPELPLYQRYFQKLVKRKQDEVKDQVLKDVPRTAHNRPFFNTSIHIGSSSAVNQGAGTGQTR